MGSLGLPGTSSTQFYTTDTATSGQSGEMAGLSEKMKNKLIQLERLQYELTKQVRFIFFYFKEPNSYAVCFLYIQIFIVGICFFFFFFTLPRLHYFIGIYNLVFEVSIVSALLCYVITLLTWVSYPACDITGTVAYLSHYGSGVLLLAVGSHVEHVLLRYVLLYSATPKHQFKFVRVD